MLRGLAEQTEAAQNLAQFKEGASGPESSGADWPGPSGLEITEDRTDAGSAAASGT